MHKKTFFPSLPTSSGEVRVGENPMTSARHASGVFNSGGDLEANILGEWQILLARTLGGWGSAGRVNNFVGLLDKAPDEIKIKVRDLIAQLHAIITQNGGSQEPRFNFDLYHRV